MTSDLKRSKSSEEYFGLNLKEIHEKGIEGRDLKIAIINAFQNNQGVCIQLDHKAFKKPPNRLIELDKIRESGKRGCHALISTAIAVGEPYEKAYLKCGEQTNELDYLGGVAPKAKATVF